MKDSYLINYSLFCQRRNFSLEDFVRQNKQLSFSEVRNYFLEKDVEPPSESVFIDIQKKILLENIPVKEEKATKNITIKKAAPKKGRRRKSKND